MRPLALAPVVYSNGVRGGGALCCIKPSFGASLTDSENELDMSEGPLVFDLDGSDLPVAGLVGACAQPGPVVRLHRTIHPYPI